MDFRNLNYVPTLAVRTSEMQGLEQLPAATKDRIQPLFLLAPWRNNPDLTRAIQRVEKAFPGRDYFLDIDRNYIPPAEKTTDHFQWYLIQDPTDGYSKWWEFVAQTKHAVPCLQMHKQAISGIEKQINRAREIGRGGALRFQILNFPNDANEIAGILNNIGAADYVIILDAGWVKDTITISSKFEEIIRIFIGKINAEIPFIASYTSIPKEYSFIDGVEEVAFYNRAVISDLRRIINRPTIIYGDWASTRPRDRGDSFRGVPRIDLPLRNSWVFSRAQGKESTYYEAATQLVEAKRYWQQVEGMGVWGELMIADTARGPQFGIRAPHQNVAARINLHLHTQAFYEIDNLKGLDLDEPWQDD